MKIFVVLILIGGGVSGVVEMELDFEGVMRGLSWVSCGCAGNGMMAWDGLGY